MITLIIILYVIGGVLFAVSREYTWYGTGDYGERYKKSYSRLGFEFALYFILWFPFTLVGSLGQFIEFVLEAGVS